MFNGSNNRIKQRKEKNTTVWGCLQNSLCTNANLCTKPTNRTGDQCNSKRVVQLVSLVIRFSDDNTKNNLAYILHEYDLLSLLSPIIRIEPDEF